MKNVNEYMQLPSFFDKQVYLIFLSFHRTMNWWKLNNFLSCKWTPANIYLTFVFLASWKCYSPKNRILSNDEKNWKKYLSQKNNGKRDNFNRFLKMKNGVGKVVICRSVLFFFAKLTFEKMHIRDKIYCTFISLTKLGTNLLMCIHIHHHYQV